MPIRVLTVCLGNICRSPVAAAAIREAAADAGVDIEVDSAGTGGWHVGNAPDERMVAAAERAGLQVRGTARQVRPADLQEFDIVVAMDETNLEDLEAMARVAEGDSTVRLFRSFDPDADDLAVPDPYYGGPEGFDRVVAMMRPAAWGLVEWARHHVAA